MLVTYFLLLCMSSVTSRWLLQNLKIAAILPEMGALECVFGCMSLGTNSSLLLQQCPVPRFVSDC